MPTGISPASVDTRRSQIVQIAKQAAQASAGRPYTFGGKTASGFDCSGFVFYVYQQVFPDFFYMDTATIKSSGKFIEVKTASAGDLVLFQKGKNPYEVKRGINKEFPDHVGIVLDGNTWIGSQSSTGVAQVQFSNPWWSLRAQILLRYTVLPPV